MQKLSDASLRALQPPEKGQKLVYDASLPAFGVRLSQGGTRSFFLQHGTDRRFITLGRYPIISLSEARTEAKRLLAEFTLGKVRPQTITYSQALELFLEEKTKGRRSRTVADYKRLLNRFNYKGQLSELTHQETQRRMKRFTSEGEYNHLLVALKVFCNWAIKRRYIEHNPTLGLSAHATTTRSRVLTDAELKAIWHASDDVKLPAAFRTIVKLLILTGQRRGEIAALYWDWVSEDERTITFPATITKNGRAHTIPFRDMTYKVLDKWGAQKPIMFVARAKDTPFNGWSKSKTQLDKTSGITGWTLHDLRRTFATNLAQMGTAPHIIERLLNHITGTVSGVAAIYNRASYMAEMKAAIQLWEAKLGALVA